MVSTSICNSVIASRFKKENTQTKSQSDYIQIVQDQYKGQHRDLGVTVNIHNECHTNTNETIKIFNLLLNRVLSIDFEATHKSKTV